MKLVNLQTGALDDVPDDKAQQAFADRTHGFQDPAQPVPVKLADGRIGTVPAAKAAGAFASGATIAPADEYHKAVSEARYGGVVGGIEAGAEGAARGLTVGLSDPLAIAAAHVVGGQSAADATREHLAGTKEAHPYVSAAGEIAGAAAPVLASGGTAAPEEAAALGGEAVAEGAAHALPGAAEGVAAAAPEAAGQVTPAVTDAAAAAAEHAPVAAAPSRMASLLRAVGAPARAVAGAGEYAGQAADAILGAPGAGGAMARIARAAAKAGITGAAEGGLFGAGQQISEDVLGDHQLNAEKMAAAIGHGALYGMMTGGALGAIGTGAKELASSVLDKVAPGIDRQASVEAYKALHPKLAVTKEVVARAGGEAEVGATARKYGLLGETITEAATSSPEEILARTQAAKEQVGKAIDQKLVTSGERGASAKVSEIIEPLQKQIAELESTTAGAQKAGPLKDFRDQMAQRLGLTTEQVPRTSEEVKAWIQANPEALQKMGNGSLPPEAFTKPVIKDADVGIQQIVAERRALQQNVYQYTKSLTAPLHIDELRKFAGHLNELEESAMNRAAESVGGKEGAEFRALNKDYQRLSLIERATQDRVATQGTNQRLSLTDKISGVGTAAGAIAAGHPATALGGAAVAMGSKFVREKGNAMASVALGRLAKLDLIARASQSVDSDLEGAMSKFAEKGSNPKIRLRHFGAATSDATPQERFDKASKDVPARPTPVAAQHVEAAIPGLVAHAPKTAASLGDVVNTGASYMAGKQPKAPGAPSLLGKPPRPTPEAMSAFVRQQNAVDDPVGTIRRALETGKVHNDEVDAIQETKPALFAQVQKMGLDLVAKHGKDMPYDKLMTLSKLTKIPLDPSLSPDSVAYFQGTYRPANGNGAPPGGPAPTRGAPKRKLAGIGAASALTTGNLDNEYGP